MAVEVVAVEVVVSLSSGSRGCVVALDLCRPRCCIRAGFI